MSDEPGVFAHPETDPEARKWAMLCHISQLAGFLGIPFASIIAPLIIWLMKRDEYPFVMEQGKEVLNFQISLIVYGVVCFILMFVLVGMILLPLLLIFALVLTIIGTIKANDGQHYRYPFIFRLL